MTGAAAAGSPADANNQVPTRSEPPAGSSTWFRRSVTALPFMSDGTSDRGHGDPVRSWPAAQIRSRCPHTQVTAAERIDPFWDGLWGRSSSLSWMTSATFDARRRAGLASLPKSVSRPVEQARADLYQLHGWRRRLGLVAAVDMWRTLTAEQAAAITGDTSILNYDRTTPATLFRSGIIDVGVLDSPAGLSRRPRPKTTVYRPSRTDDFDRFLQPHMTFPEWVSVTGGQGWAPNSQFDRHNLLAGELGLRLLEYADVVTVLGEKLSSIDLLAGTGLDRPLPHADNRAADLTVIRADGMRIAIELTATTTGRFPTKVDRWARLLADLPFEDSGLMVVFVTAEPIERHHARGRSARNQAATIITQACRRHPGWSGNRVAPRIGLADWQEWFPSRHRISRNFFDLRCLTPSGPAGALWQEARWLAKQPQTETGDAQDHHDRPSEPGSNWVTGFVPRGSRNRFTAVLDNVQTLAGIPHWARNPGSGMRMWQLMLAERGFDQFPMPDPARPHRVKGVPLGSGQGVVAPARPPRRLRGL